jgi:hypothetical protein
MVKAGEIAINKNNTADINWRMPGAVFKLREPALSAQER